MDVTTTILPATNTQPTRIRVSADGFGSTVQFDYAAHAPQESAVRQLFGTDSKIMFKSALRGSSTWEVTPAKTGFDFLPAGQFDYYRSQFQTISPEADREEDDEYRVALASDHGDTKWMSISLEQAEFILKYLSNTHTA